MRPPAAGTVQYLVTAFRSTARGNPGRFTLNLGVDAGVAAARGMGHALPARTPITKAAA